MLKKRLIFTLLADEKYFYLSRNFRLQKVGNLQWLKENYNFSKIAFHIDELAILNVSKGRVLPQDFCDLVEKVSKDCFSPITVGGGLRNLDDVKMVLRAGADKVLLNTSFYDDEALIVEISKEFGAQCIVIGIDFKRIKSHGSVDTYFCFKGNGEIEAGMSLHDALIKARNLPVGEVYLNSIDRDGTGQGYELGALESIPNGYTLPVIFAGGVGNVNHLIEGYGMENVDAIATANLFNFMGPGLKNAREKLIEFSDDLPSWPAIEEIRQYVEI